MKKTLLLLLVFCGSVNLHSQWIQSQADSNVYSIKDLSFINPDTGFIVGELNGGVGLIAKTTNGGNNWTQWTPQTGTALSRRDNITHINDSVLYVIGRDGIIHKTNNQGLTWTNDNGPIISADVIAIEGINNSVSLIKYPNGQVYRSSDSLQSWNWVTSVNSSLYHYYHPTNPFHFINDSVGFTLGNAIKKTTDRGLNWVDCKVDTNFYYNSIFMINHDSGFAVGDNGSFLKTIDGGLNWNLSFISSQNLLDIEFINERIGVCVGGGNGMWSDSNGVLLTTLDGGITWESKEIDHYRLNAIQFIDSVGYIVGSRGQIFKLDNFNTLTIQNITPSFTQLKTWPNPTSNWVHIEGTNHKKGELKVYDVNGNLLESHSNFTSNKVSIAHYPNGTYFIQWSSFEELRFGMVIKQ